MAKKKAVFIISPYDFRDEELFEPKKVLEAEGISVTIASTTLEACLGKLGGEVVPDVLLSAVVVADYDAIVFIGGPGCLCYWDDPIAHVLVNDTVIADKVLGAICSAPVTLANAGVLKGKRATCYKGDQSRLEDKDVLYTGDRVTFDGNIITANGPDSSTQFGHSLVKGLLVLP